MFFHPGSGALELKFHVTLEQSDTSSIRLVLELDGQPFEYRVPPKPNLAVWPAANPATGSASLTWHERYGAQPRIAHIGPWAFFRLVDEGREERESDVRAHFSYQRQNHSARLMVEALGVRNPFFNRAWQSFSCAF